MTTSQKVFMVIVGAVVTIMLLIILNKTGILDIQPGLREAPKQIPPKSLVQKDTKGAPESRGASFF